MIGGPIETHVAAGCGFRSSAATHPGARRPVNEDAWLNRPDIGLWAVADGAGGHEAGAAAARAAISALDDIASQLTGGELLAEVRRRLGCVHEALRHAAAERGADVMMATTIVALIARQGHFACVWAGDSRLYRWQGAQFEQMTRDHNLVQEMIDRGEDGSTCVEPNVITRALGSPMAEPGLEKVTGAVMPADRFLLCSDGVTKVFTDDALAVLLGEGTGETGAERIVAAACARGAGDNVTAVVVEIGDCDEPDAAIV